MSVAIFDPDRSDRHSILYNAIKHHIRDNSAILDIGCGHAPMAGLIYACHPGVTYFGFDCGASYIERCKELYPRFEFKQFIYKDSITALILRRYDIVLHIGIDSHAFSRIYKIHGKLLADVHLKPDYALLETGYRDGYKMPFESYSRAMNTYLAHRYSIADEGQFEFNVDGHHLRDRRWCVMKREA